LSRLRPELGATVTAWAHPDSQPEHILKGERAYEKAAADAKAKGLALPERVFERSTGRTAHPESGFPARLVIRLKKYACTVCYGQSFM
jgi:hypothetical protein